MLLGIILMPGFWMGFWARVKFKNRGMFIYLMYLKLLKRAWNEIFGNPGVFLPDIFGLIMTFIFGGLALYFSGLGGVFLQIVSGVETEMTEAVAYFINNPGAVVNAFLGVVFFIVTTFFIGAGFSVAKYKMFSDMAGKKKTGFFKEFSPANKKYYWRFIGVRIAVFFSFLLCFAAALLIGGAFGVISKLFGVAVVVILLVVGMIYLGLMLFFIYPALFIEDKGIMEAFKRSFEFARRNLKKTVITALVVIGIMVVASIVTQILIMPLDGFKIVQFAVSSVIALIPGVWSGYYIFLAYKEFGAKARAGK